MPVDYINHNRGCSLSGPVGAHQGYAEGLRRLLKVSEAAKIVGCSKAHLYNAWINTGLLPVVRLGRDVRVDPADLARVIEAAKTGGRRRGA